MKLLKNPVYMLLNLASVFEMVIVTGFITFVPKYLETQFGLRTSQANLYTGENILLPPMVFCVWELRDQSPVLWRVRSPPTLDKTWPSVSTQILVDKNTVLECFCLGFFLNWFCCPLEYVLFKLEH